MSKPEKYFVEQSLMGGADHSEPFEADSLLEAHKLALESRGYEVVETNENGRVLK